MATRPDREPRKKLRRVARALYEGDATPDHEAIAAFGLKLDDEEPDAIECWPENWQALQIFAALGTQWNVVQGSVIGLRYESIPVVLTEFGIKKKERAGLMQSLRIMENEALLVLRK